MARFSIFGTDTSRRIAEADSVAVIGLGRFGQSLALELMAGGTEVLGIDVDEDLVQSAERPAHPGRARRLHEGGGAAPALRSTSSTASSSRSATTSRASILTCSALLGMKIPVIWAKALDDRHGLILEQLGVHHVIYPEKDMGRQASRTSCAAQPSTTSRSSRATRSSSPRRPLGSAACHSARAGLRKEFGVTVAAFKKPGAEWHNADADTVLGPDDRILIVGPTREAEGFAQLR